MIELTRGAKAIIFDCDGTLADTMPAHYQAWDATLTEYGYSLERAELMRHMGKPTIDFIREICQERGWQIDPEEFTAKKEKYFKNMLGNVLAIEPVAQVARDLAEQLPLAVVSGGVAENVNLTLESISLRSLFRVVLTADDPVKPKPSPDIFLEAARRLGVNPEDCVVFEDAPTGIAGALAAGMRVVDVRNFL